MSELPIPAKIFFADFSLSLFPCKISRMGKIVGTLQGLTNEDEDGAHVAFLYPADIRRGDILYGDGENYIVKKIRIDTYKRQPELVKAYY